MAALGWMPMRVENTLNGLQYQPCGWDFTFLTNVADFVWPYCGFSPMDLNRVVKIRSKSSANPVSADFVAGGLAVGHIYQEYSSDRRLPCILLYRYIVG